MAKAKKPTIPTPTRKTPNSSLGLLVWDGERLDLYLSDSLELLQSTHVEVFDATNHRLGRVPKDITRRFNSLTRKVLKAGEGKGLEEIHCLLEHAFVELADLMIEVPSREGRKLSIFFE